MKSVFKPVLMLSVLALLAGCAQLSPQQIAFQPVVSADSLPAGNGRTFWVDVVDGRSSSVIGQRGGVYENSSAITATGDLRQQLEDQIVGALEVAGFEAVDMNADFEWTVTLEELSYQMNDIDAARKDAKVAAEVSVEIVKANSSFANSFRAQRSKEFFRYPDEAENEAMLTETFDDAIERMFSDAALNRFLR
ncbi:YajG family lipoprotein [Saccharospirillum mangrovi]|uniref:YajG family lipoprotein n=1 Tax=Saccharospirillum mangrovi TaxID=2161747 RepID=UPI000D3930F6|nr:YajG family lipoprotein [Saccharospirillum mangrovi]